MVYKFLKGPNTRMWLVRKFWKQIPNAKTRLVVPKSLPVATDIALNRCATLTSAGKRDSWYDTFTKKFLLENLVDAV
jgi:hypothetical protein